MLPDEPVTEVACEKASGRKCCVGSRSVLHQDGPRKFPTLFQLIDEPYFSKHSTTRLICRSEGKFRPWNLASRRLNAILTVVTELVSYHFFTTKILSSRSRIIKNDQKRTKWVTNRNYLGWSKFTSRHRNVTQTVFFFRTTIIGYKIITLGSIVAKSRV